MPPEVGHLPQVELELGRAQDLEAFPDACIIPYSMPLWTIFTKWPEPELPTCAQPPLGQVVEERLDLLHAVGGAADHDAVALLEPPDPAR